MFRELIDQSLTRMLSSIFGSQSFIMTSIPIQALALALARPKWCGLSGNYGGQWK